MVLQKHMFPVNNYVEKHVKEFYLCKEVPIEMISEEY